MHPYRWQFFDRRSQLFTISFDWFTKKHFLRCAYHLPRKIMNPTDNKSCPILIEFLLLQNFSHEYFALPNWEMKIVILPIFSPLLQSGRSWRVLSALLVNFWTHDFYRAVFSKLCYIFVHFLIHFVYCIDIPNYSKIFQNIPKLSKIFQNIPKYSKILRNIPKYSEIFQNIFIQSILDPNLNNWNSKQKKRA